jgi:hypothetical protein
LKTSFEECLSLVGEVVGYAIWGCGIRLVDVNTLDWATKGLGNWDGDGSFRCILGWGWSLGLSSYWLDAGVDGLTTNGVIEDEDLGSTGPVLSSA